METAAYLSAKALNLSRLGLTEVPSELLDKTDLEAVDLSQNMLTELPPQLARLTNLHVLNLSSNQLGALPSEFGQFTKLSLLDLRDNWLTAVPSELGQLTRLQVLDLSSNRLTVLPAELGELPRGIDLRLDGNSLSEPLPGLVQLGVSAVLDYLRSLPAAVPLYEAKVLLVGEGNVGKSSLAAALRGEPFVAERPTTHGIQVARLVLGHPERSVDLVLNMWDFGGQPVYRVTHPFFFSRRALYVVVWRPREGWEREVETWCERVRLRVDDARVLVVATYADTDQRRADLDYPGLQRRFPGVLAGQYLVDNRTGRGIPELRAAIAAEAARLPQMGERISRYWVDARDKLLAQPDWRIPYTTFVSVCARQRLDEGQTATLAALLHDLGHIAHYADDDGLRDTVVLKPEWLTRAISYVLDDQPTAASGGILDHAHLRRIWHDPGRDVIYPPGDHPYFLRLMERFDISYRILDEDASLVAQLVPSIEPRLPWRHDTPLLPGLRSLTLRYRIAPEAAEGLMAWVTVRNHHYTKGRHWRLGVFLEHPEHAAQALVNIDDDGRHLVLTVRAPSPDYFFSILRGSIEDLLRRRYPGMKYTRLVPCTQPLPDGGRCPGQFDFHALERYRERERATIDCHTCLEPQSVSRLLTGFAPTPDIPVRQILEEVRHETQALVGLAVQQRIDTAALNAQLTNQLWVLLRAISSELPDCPRLFTLVPAQLHSPERGLQRAIAALQERFRLTLWCEDPDQPHPWLPAQYEFSRPREWLQTVAPYALTISRLLSASLPIVGATLDLALPQAYEDVRKQLELMKTLVAPLSDEEGGALPHLPKYLRPSVAEGGALRTLRALIVELDPQQHFGDLRRVMAPSGDYLWICPTIHYSRYYPDLPVLPPSPLALPEAGSSSNFSGAEST
jgi:hypothetical protein